MKNGMKEKEVNRDAPVQGRMEEENVVRRPQVKWGTRMLLVSFGDSASFFSAALCVVEGSDRLLLTKNSACSFTSLAISCLNSSRDSGSQR